jgi:hypothetical protein
MLGNCFNGSKDLNLRPFVMLWAQPKGPVDPHDNKPHSLSDIRVDILGTSA